MDEEYEQLMLRHLFTDVREEEYPVGFEIEEM